MKRCQRPEPSRNRGVKTLDARLTADDTSRLAVALASSLGTVAGQNSNRHVDDHEGCSSACGQECACHVRGQAEPQWLVLTIAPREDPLTQSSAVDADQVHRFTSEAGRRMAPSECCG